MSINRLDPTSAPRMSTNMAIDRQTPKTDFGDRIASNAGTVAGAVANGAALAAPFVPGGAIVSAAVSSVGTFAGGSSSGQSNGAVSAQYASTVTTLNGGGGGGLNTTLSAPGTVGANSSGGGTVSGGGGTTSVNVNSGADGSALAQMQASIVSSQQENAKMMKVQTDLQRENQVFSTVSNVLKVRHDTIKGTVSNIR